MVRDRVLGQGGQGPGLRGSREGRCLAPAWRRGVLGCPREARVAEPGEARAAAAGVAEGCEVLWEGRSVGASWELRTAWPGCSKTAV